MDAMPEYTWILALLGFFLAVFVTARVLARTGGHKE
jgi:hypothetical protein